MRPQILSWAPSALIFLLLTSCSCTPLTARESLIITSRSIPISHHDDFSTPYSSTNPPLLTHRTILPNTPRDYRRIAIRKLVMIIPSPLSIWPAVDDLLYNRIAQFYSMIIQYTTGIAADPRTYDPLPINWSLTPPQPVLDIRQGLFWLKMTTGPGQTIPWEFLDWFANEVRHGNPVGDGGGGYASFFEEWFAVPGANQVIFVSFKALGPWQYLYGTGPRTR